MSMKQDRKSKQSRRETFVKDAVSSVLWEKLPTGIQYEVAMYGDVLRSSPMADYGNFERDVFAKHIERRVTAYVSLGPKCLHNKTVIDLLDRAFANKNVEIQVLASFSGAIRELVAAGIAQALRELFQQLETGVKQLSDAALSGYGLDKSAAEMYRSLASEYSGTFDELLETAKSL